MVTIKANNETLTMSEWQFKIIVDMMSCSGVDPNDLCEDQTLSYHSRKYGDGKLEVVNGDIFLEV